LLSFGAALSSLEALLKLEGRKDAGVGIEDPILCLWGVALTQGGGGGRSQPWESKQIHSAGAARFNQPPDRHSSHRKEKPEKRVILEESSHESCAIRWKGEVHLLNALARKGFYLVFSLVSNLP
jgi:hypothetical protein